MSLQVYLENNCIAGVQDIIFLKIKTSGVCLSLSLFCCWNAVSTTHSVGDRGLFWLTVYSVIKTGRQRDVAEENTSQPIANKKQRKNRRARRGETPFQAVCLSDPPSQPSASVRSTLSSEVSSRLISWGFLRCYFFFILACCFPFVLFPCFFFPGILLWTWEVDLLF